MKEKPFFHQIVSQINPHLSCIFLVACIPSQDRVRVFLLTNKIPHYLKKPLNLTGGVHLEHNTTYDSRLVEINGTSVQARKVKTRGASVNPTETKVTNSQLAIKFEMGRGQLGKVCGPVQGSLEEVHMKSLTLLSRELGDDLRGLK